MTKERSLPAEESLTTEDPLNAEERRIVDDVLAALTAEEPPVASAAVVEERREEPPAASTGEEQGEGSHAVEEPDINAIFFRITLLEERVVPAERAIAKIEKRLPPLEVGTAVLEKQQRLIEKLIRDFNHRIEAMEALVQQAAAFTDRLEAMEAKNQRHERILGRLERHTGLPVDMETFLAKCRAD